MMYGRYIRSSRLDFEPGTAQLSRGVVKRVWGFAKRYWVQITFYLLAIGLSSLVAVTPPLLVRELLNKAIPEHSLTLVNVIGAAAVGVALANAGLALAQRLLSARIGEGLIYDLRTALFDHVQSQPLAFFTHSQTGALVSRMNNDVIGAQQALTGTLGSVLSNVIGLITTLTAMFLLNWKITLLALVVLPVFILPAKRVGRRLQAIARESMQLNAGMNTMMNERFNVAGALLVMLFGRRAREQAEFRERAGAVRDIGIRQAMYGRIFFAALGLVGAVGTAAVYWFGARLVISGGLRAGDVVALAAYVTQVYMPLTALTNARVDIMTAFVSFDRVFEVLDYPSPIADRPGAVPLPDPPAGRIQFEHVGFSYPTADDSSIASLLGAAELAAGSPGQPVLHDVSFTVEPGELIALVGPSGAGKTTIAMLVPRVYDASEGTVRVDGVDVRDLRLESLRTACGLVAQDPHLFHDTILANLLYAKPEATMEEIEAACRAARIADLIHGLPKEYETVVGERGYRLSGGEKQRLAIARLLLADPAIVILDEATAHLDSESEVHIQEALAAALANRTSLVIAHRLSTIVNADRILVVDAGRVVEQGTHQELLAAGGLYAELYDTQFNRAPTSPPVHLPASDTEQQLEWPHVRAVDT
jgi:ATP-binding cassette subfamily B protein